MSFQIKQQGRAQNLRDGSPLLSPSANALGVDYQLLTPYKATLKVSGVMTCTAANDYGSLELCTFQDRNLHLLAIEVDLSLVKGNTATGIVAATDLDLGLGSAAASAQTLATTMIDRVEKSDHDANELTVTYQAHTQGQSTATYPLQQADAAANKLYLNCGLPGGITVDDTLTVTGTVDLYFIDLGNKTS
jgi:hypothetical protein